MSLTPVRIAVPTGRLRAEAVAALEEAGFGCAALWPNAPGRQLTVAGEWGGVPVRAQLLKPRAIPALLARGYFDLALLGRDVFLNDPAEASLEWRPAQYVSSRVRLVVAGPADLVRGVPAAQLPGALGHGRGRPIRIATEYRHLVDRWATAAGWAPYLIIDSYGSTEGYVPELADAIIDVVETGATLTANGLLEVATVAASELGVAWRRRGPYEVGTRPEEPLVEALARRRPA